MSYWQGKLICEVLFFFPMSVFSCVLFAFCFLFVTQRFSFSDVFLEELLVGNRG